MTIDPDWQSHPAEINWSGLSPRSRVILRTVAVPLADGYEQIEVAERLGKSPGWIGLRMKELRRELRGEPVPASWWDADGPA